MDEEQSAINLNVQERLRSLEAERQVSMAFMTAIIETHPRPDALRKQFAFHYETLHVGWLSKAIADDWIDSAAAFRAVLDQAFDLPRR